jgi:pentatricopeptide repeat protein
LLQALATHPDYMLRNEILMSLKDHWFELRISGCHDLVIGLLRERQIELAIDKVEQMRKQKMKVEGWLYNLLVYYLCNLKEFDEVIRFLRIMIDEGITIRPTLWYYVLDTAAQACHVRPPFQFLPPLLSN